MKPNQPESFALMGQGDHVNLYTGEQYELQSLDELKELQSTHPKSTFIFANPFHTISERIESLDHEPGIPLKILATKSSKAVQLTRQHIREIQNNLLKDDGRSILQALTTITESEGIIRMNRAQFQMLIPDCLGPAHQSLAKNPLENPSVRDVDFEKQVIRAQEHITNGDISQVVLSRAFQGKFKNYDADNTATTLFRRLLDHYGSYMTFLMLDKEGHALVGSTPERHVTVDSIGNDEQRVTRTAIAGTLPKKDIPKENVESALELFLQDPKEINELAMVTDEDSKPLFKICDHGGQVNGPFLREMPAVFHTEYEIIGRSSQGLHPLDILRANQHAATLVGSPIESAAHIIETQEEHDRRYYGGEFGVLQGKHLDTSVIIRTAEIMPDGDINLQAGAGIVRDSVPTKEAHETRAKVAGVMSALLTQDVPDSPISPNSMCIKRALKARNEDTNYFLRTLQSQEKETVLQGKEILILHNGDDFSETQAMMLRHMGATVRLVSLPNLNPKEKKYFFQDIKNADILLLGPGPGHVNIPTSSPYIQALRDNSNEIFNQEETPLLGICLGHQFLCDQIGLEVTYEDRTKQGSQRIFDVFGTHKPVGVYNSFSALSPKKPLDDIEITSDENGRVVSIEGDRFLGIQYHPESFMTPDGYTILKQVVLKLLD